MSINLINPGLIPNDGTGDPLRVGAIKVNESISELYSILNASVVPAQTNNAGKLLTTNGTSLLWVESFAATNPQADWLSTSGPSQILNKPLLSLVATSGSYLDLTNKPIVPSNTNQLINGANFAVRSEITWNSLSGKPTFALVATTGNYLDLTNRPASDIPSQSGNGGRYLTTNGSVLSWSTVVGGGGEGTSITTSRTVFTATAGQTVFTGVGTYEIGAGQLRVYIDGVRQFPTAYTETSTTSFTLTAGVAVGTAVLAEVDGYVSAPSVLPAQTGNDGKFLTTNGTLVSWATIPSVYVLPTATTSILGGVKVDGTTITINGSGVISSVGGSAGTVINTSRTVFTATTNQTVFTGVGTYTIGAGQLRVYIDGVRQFPTAYTETSTTSFTLTAGVAVGTAVLAEVDGYVGAPVSYTLPIATTTVLGGVKVDGTTITINPSTGVISGSSTYSLPTATTSVLGGVKVDGTTITINGNGVISSVGGGGATDLTNVSTNILPAVDNTYDLGSADKRFRHLFVGPGSIYIGDESRSITVTPTSIDLPVGTTIGGEEPLKTTIQNIFNEIINNYLTYEVIPGAPDPIIDIDQLDDSSGRLVTTAITGITYPGNDSSVSTIGNQTVILTGRGFQRACNVYVNNSPVVSTAFINSTSVQFTTTAQDAGTYLITLANPDSTTAVLSPGILYLEPGTPRFTFPSGLFATFSRNTVVSKTLTVTDGIPPYTITISSGTLPSGLTLNTTNGIISGTTPNVTFDTIFNFTAQVTDSSAPPLSTTSPYYILVALPIPVELTIGGPGTIGASTLISNRAFFIEYEEDITNAPAITISGTSIISNKTFFIEYEEDITNTPTFTITGTAIRSYDNPTPSGTQKAIFGFGSSSGSDGINITNLVSNTGEVATDTTGVGTGRSTLAAASYGSDKAIFGYGYTFPPLTSVSTTNLVSNTGVVATDTAGVGTTRYALAATNYGNDKAIFGYGTPIVGALSLTNLVSNIGVVATDTTGVGTARTRLAATGYGTTGQAVFAYGFNNSNVRVQISNLVSNTGVVATDTTGVGTARSSLAAVNYGSSGQAMFGYGYSGSGNEINTSLINLVSNTGVIATDTTGVGTARGRLAAARYGSNKAIFGYGDNGQFLSMTNLVSSTGAVATDTTGVGTTRSELGAAGYSST